MAHRVLLTTLVALAGVSMLGGCSTSLEVNTKPPPAAQGLDKDQLADSLIEQLVRQTGRRPDVRCIVIQDGRRIGFVDARVNDRGRIEYAFDVVAPLPPNATTQPSPGPGR